MYIPHNVCTPHRLREWRKPFIKLLKKKEGNSWSHFIKLPKGQDWSGPGGWLGVLSLSFSQCPSLPMPVPTEDRLSTGAGEHSSCRPQFHFPSSMTGSTKKTLLYGSSGKFPGKDSDGFSVGDIPTCMVTRWLIGSWTDTILAMIVYDLVDFTEDPAIETFFRILMPAYLVCSAIFVLRVQCSDSAILYGTLGSS